MGSLLRRNLAVLAVAAASLSYGTSARAHDWGPYPGLEVGKNVWFADSNSHTFCYWGLDSTSTAAAEDARRNALDAETDMRTSLDQSCPSDVDVVAHDSTDLGPGIRGLDACRTLATASTCQIADVYLDKSNVGSTQRARSKTLCHEFGHSVGLRHFPPGSPGVRNSEPSCMVSGTSTATRYSGHEVASHINRTPPGLFHSTWPSSSASLGTSHPRRR